MVADRPLARVSTVVVSSVGTILEHVRLHVGGLGSKCLMTKLRDLLRHHLARHTRFQGFNQTILDDVSVRFLEHIKVVGCSLLECISLFDF